MSKGWNNWRRAKEDSYFEKQNRLAIEKLTTAKKTGHLSPETGEPMEVVALKEGIQVERDPTTGGIWVDDEEKLEKLMDLARDEARSWKDLLKTPIR